jgi:hypothetical protein
MQRWLYDLDTPNNGIGRMYFFWGGGPAGGGVYKRKREHEVSNGRIVHLKVLKLHGLYCVYNYPEHVLYNGPSEKM